jgi:transcriptional regulator GlxA family with amidase domain
VDTGRILTGGGVSLGIDMTLHLLQRFLGHRIAEETARILEYRSAWNANAAALPDIVEIERLGAGPRAASLSTVHQTRRSP